MTADARAALMQSDCVGLLTLMPPHSPRRSLPILYIQTVPLAAYAPVAAWDAWSVQPCHEMMARMMTCSMMSRMSRRRTEHSCCPSPPPRQRPCQRRRRRWPRRARPPSAPRHALVAITALPRCRAGNSQGPTRPRQARLQGGSSPSPDRRSWARRSRNCTRSSSHIQLWMLVLRFRSLTSLARSACAPRSRDR